MSNPPPGTGNGPASGPTVTDEQLLALCRGGRQDAFAALMERYRLELFHFLFRFAGNRAAAEDLFQESFLQVYLSAESFDPERRFKPWLFTIAANKARDHLRRNNRRQTSALSAPIGSDREDGREFMDLLQADLQMPGEDLERHETEELVRQVMAQMPDHLREVLILAYFQQFPYKQIAEVLSVPLGTVKSRLHAAVAAFAQLWKERFPGSEGFPGSAGKSGGDADE
ncbi:MAG: RNA polymerase sigma factor [Planctomycetota bacterium]|nr:RNA polymerase sigma factor [Planctomycetota bacterium]